MHSGGGSTRTPPPSIKMGTPVDGSVGGGSVKGGCVVAVVVGGAVVSAALVVVGAVVVAFPFRELACLVPREPQALITATSRTATMMSTGSVALFAVVRTL